jgi:di/tricarboxylate transporter
LITPRSALIGKTIVEANIAEKYNVYVLGISRRGQPLEDVPLTGIELTFGDALLVRGAWQSIDIMAREARNFVVVGKPEGMAAVRGLSPRSFVAIAAMVGMLLMMLTGIVPTVVAVLITGLVMILGGCLNMEEAYRAINMESVVLIAAMLPMSTALEETGGAAFMANGLVDTLGAFHPLLLLAGIFLMTTAFTQVISNTATTVLVAPIAIQAAANMGMAPHPLMMMVAVGASSAFLTPIASPVNTLVMTPGNYRFGDFMKSGLPLLILFLLVSLALVPLIWS